MQNQNFYNIINPIFHGSLLPSQSEGIEAIISGCAQFDITDKRMIAYILATPWWETGRKMRGVPENGKGAGHAYGKMIDQDGKPYTTPNQIYYGRGLTQNTWRCNYLMLTNQSYAKFKGWNFLENPDLLLESEPSIWATIHCMYNGLYTGVGLSHYFNATETDWLNARKIINGLDQAKTIASAAQTFYQALLAT